MADILHIIGDKNLLKFYANFLKKRILITWYFSFWQSDIINFLIYLMWVPWGWI